VSIGGLPAGFGFVTEPGNGELVPESDDGEPVPELGEVEVDGWEEGAGGLACCEIAAGTHVRKARRKTTGGRDKCMKVLQGKYPSDL
jgi:hypothetical protein